MPNDLELDRPPGVCTVYCDPGHVAHTSTHGLTACPACRTWHHDGYRCHRRAEIRYLDNVIAPAPPMRDWCEDCDDYHDGPDECPREVIECGECESDHPREDDCPREWCGDCDDFHDRDQWGSVECPGWPCDDCEVNHDYGEECPRPYCDECGSHHGRYDSCSDSDGLLESYDYTPDLIFRGDGPAYYGMEFEVSAYGEVMTEAVQSAQSSDQDGVLYFKEDGSVSGFEMVTHPMSYEWAMGNFPWRVLREFDSAGCSIDRLENGIHVHVSRDAFASPAHLYRWMKFFYRNQEFAQNVARREGCHWSKFSSTHRKGHAAHVKAAKLKRIADETGRSSVYERYADATRADSTGDRYSAINTTNSATLEVRMFASTLDVAEAQSALQFVAATVEYTRALTCRDVIKRDGWTPAAFTAWLGEQDGKYAALASLVAAF